MKPFRLLTVAVCLAAGSASFAEEVSLSYVLSPFNGPPVYQMGQRLKTANSPIPAKAPRLRSSQPIVATANLGRGGDTTVTFLLDESAGTGRGHDRLYVDANRNGDLTDDSPVRGLYRRGGMRFGPLALRIDVDGRRRIYHAVVEGQTRGPKPEYFLKSLGYFTGTAPFGAKRHPIALVDFNGNGLYGESFRAFSPDPSQMGDMLLVDANHDGRFEQGGIIPKETLYCGKCIVVDGRFYELAMQADGSAVQVKPAAVKYASLRSGYPNFGILLQSEHGLFPIQGQNGVAQVPPGEYRVLGWSLEHPTSEGKWLVQGGVAGTEREAPRLAVSEGGSTPFQLTTPLMARITTSRETPGSLSFQLSFTTATGENIGDISVDGRRPPEPTLKLMDDQGNEIASLPFHYG